MTTGVDVDSDLLAAMWHAGASYAQITSATGLTTSQISYRVGKLGLPPRQARAHHIGVAEDRPEESRHAEPKMPRMAAHPFWTPERDVMVFRTGGRYGDIAALARTMGKTHQTVLGRWHALRAAGAR